MQSGNKKALNRFSSGLERFRKERDLNPRHPFKRVRVLSRDVPSATQPSFQEIIILFKKKEQKFNRWRFSRQGSMHEVSMHPLAVEGIPMAGMDRAIGVLDDDAVDGQINVGCFADGKFVAEGRLGDFFDLGEGIAARRSVRHCDEALSQGARRVLWQESF